MGDNNAKPVIQRCRNSIDFLYPCFAIGGVTERKIIYTLL